MGDGELVASDPATKKNWPICAAGLARATGFGTVSSTFAGLERIDRLALRRCRNLPRVCSALRDLRILQGQRLVLQFWFTQAHVEDGSEAH